MDKYKFGLGVHIITELKTEDDWCRGRARFSELSVLTGISRAYLQSIIVRDLWKFQGKGTGAGNAQMYSFVDVLAIQLAAVLVRWGFKVMDAWRIVREHVGVVVLTRGMQKSKEDYTVELGGDGGLLVIPASKLNSLIEKLRNGQAYAGRAKRVSLSPRDASRKRKEKTA